MENIFKILLILLVVFLIYFFVIKQKFISCDYSQSPKPFPSGNLPMEQSEKLWNPF
jgi:hypothetical protein